MDFSIIAAYAENRVIGNGNEIPWRKTKEDRERYREDMLRFQDLTSGHPVIMGRRTYDSIPVRFKPLDMGRTNIVITRNKSYQEKGIVLCRSMEEAMETAEDFGALAFIAGGQQIYRLAINNPEIRRMDLTEIHSRYDGDSFFPEFNLVDWTETKREEKEDYSFVTYERVQ